MTQHSRLNLLCLRVLAVTIGASIAVLPLTTHAQNKTVDAVVAKNPFSLSEFPNLEKQCLNAAGNAEMSKSIVEMLEAKYEGKKPEALRMLIAILQGSQMGNGGGWFGPAKQKYDWKWLAAQQKIEADGTVTEDTFQGSKRYFRRLDRNGDGTLGEDDLDWGPSSLFMREQSIANSVFRRMEQNADGKLTRDELLRFFDRARGEEEDLNIDAFRRSLQLGVGSNGFFPGDEPETVDLIRGFFASEIGSWQEGPGTNEEAPDFELKTQDGKQTIRLKDWIGKKPIVLVFGNFSCGPFRRNYPDFDDIAQRYKDQATFFGVYVREAHPADGWIMESNTRVGVKLKQPRTNEERIAVAQTCSTTLKYSIPLLVDTIDDRVGNLYSGMPARAYVIGKDGKVTYQGGRGPFGFRPGEMEQALVMTLMAE